VHDGSWSGVLGDIFVATRQAGAWQLTAPSALTAAKDEVVLEELCMRAAEGDFCVRGAWESQAAWNVRSSMNEVPLSLLQPLLPEEMTVSGHVSGDVTAAGTAGLPTSVDVDLTQDAGSSTYALQDSVATLAYRDARLRVRADNDSTSVGLNAWLAETDAGDFGSMTVELQLGSLAELLDDRSTHALMDAVAAEWMLRSSLDGMPLAILAPLLPHQSSVSGTVSGHLSTAGQQGAPDYLELELRPSPGRVTYVSRDKEEVIRHQETLLTLASAGDSLIGNVSLQLAPDSATEFGSFSAEFSLSSVAELIENAVADSGVNSLTGDWNLSSSIGAMPVSLAQTLIPDSLIVGGTISGRMSASGTARTPAHLDLELRPSPGTLEYRLRDTAAALEYRAAELTVNTEGDSLVGSLRLEIGDGNDADFGTLSITAGLPALADLMDEIAAEGTVAALLDEWEISSRVDQIPLAIFNSIVPAGATLAGSLDGELEASAAADGTVTGRLELRPRTATTQRYFGSSVHTIRLTDTRVRLSAGSDGVQGEATFALARPDSPLQGTVTAAVTVPQLTRLDQPLLPQPFEATVKGDIDLSVLDDLFEHVSGSEGRLDLDLEAGNTFDEIEVTGYYWLRGRTDVVSLGIELRDVDIRASDSPEGGFAIEGSVSSGGGLLTIEGVSPAIPTRESPARLTIRGRDFRAVRTEQVSLVVSPDLEVLAGGQAVDVRGEIDVPRARIELLEVPQAAVSPSRDVVYVGQTDEVRSEPIDVTAEVNLTLGENVVFRGLGFSTHLDGSILAIERPGRVTQGRGELVFREGIYRGYGQNLTVEPGRLILAGPIDDPTVDVRAYRQATDGTRAGFLVGGTLKSLEVDVWSDPAKTDSDALSYILFGRPLSQGSEADQVQAGNAAAVLGGNMLAMSMASKIGLDDARIETGARQQETAFYAGKYLSPRLYVAYGVGLYEPINVLRVRYLLSRKFTVQAETGTRDSGDILYRIEF
jgi:autotransporter translocation and assembly factor TamB